jgi:hypothetical protein
MLPRVVLALVIVAVAVVIARRLDRRPADAPARDSYPVPAQLDRDDFVRPDAPWLVVLFSSASCRTCAAVAAKVAPLESERVATCEAEAVEHKDLHDRYRIEAVPMLVIADGDGVVRASFVGAVTDEELGAALARTALA